MATADVRVDELRRIYDRDGYLQASSVVQAATPKRSALHGEFEWDDIKAGHHYRLAQARRIIRVTPMIEPTGVKRRYVHIPVEKIEGPSATVQQTEGVYKPIHEVVREPKDYERALRELCGQRSAMDQTIRDLKRAAKTAGQQPNLLPQLEDGMKIVKNTLRLMLKDVA